MSTPSRLVFVAHPLSAVRDPDNTKRIVDMVRTAFRDRGWDVRPAETDDMSFERRAAASAAPDIVRANIDAVRTSDLLVVVAGDFAEPSSIWVEAGIALAVAVPVAVLSDDRTRLPFLLRAAVGLELGTGRPAAVIVPLALSDAMPRSVEDAVGVVCDAW